MADEIRTTGTIRLQRANVDFPISVSSHSKDQTGEGMATAVQNIGTTAETVDFGDVGTAGYCYFRNLDTVNYVEVGFTVTATWYDVIKLDPGDWAILPLGTANGGTWQAKANTAACELHFLILED